MGDTIACLDGPASPGSLGGGEILEGRRILAVRRRVEGMGDNVKSGSTGERRSKLREGWTKEE